MKIDQHGMSRRIEIDAGHRVADHASKCSSPHGHRYVVEAELHGTLAKQGEQRGMVTDFAFVKNDLMRVVHEPCDHAMIFERGDRAMEQHFEAVANNDPAAWAEWWKRVDADLAIDGFFAGRGAHGWKICIVTFTPTAENLARWWYGRLAPLVITGTEDRGFLRAVHVWETPNCRATFPA